MKLKVTVAGQQRAIYLEPKATIGAVLGENLTFEDGTVVTIARLKALIAPEVDEQTFVATIWRLIAEIPDNVVSVAALGSAGFVVRRTGGGWTTRAVLGTAGRVEVVEGAGEDGDTVVDLAPEITGRLLPPGGAEDEVLAKSSDADYDAEWVPAA